MGKHVEPRERIVQRSIGFKFRQIEFFNKYPDFKPDIFCRKAINDQIEQIDTEFLKKEDEKAEDKL